MVEIASKATMGKKIEANYTNEEQKAFVLHHTFHADNPLFYNAAIQKYRIAIKCKWGSTSIRGEKKLKERRQKEEQIQNKKCLINWIDQSLEYLSRIQRN